MTLVMATVSCGLALAIAQSAGPRDPGAAALLVALGAPLAATVIPAGAVDERASGFERLVETQPLPRVAAFALKAASAFVLAAALVAAPVLLVVALGRAPLAPTLAAFGLVALWTALAATHFGLSMRGPSAATGVWVFLCLVNLLGVLASSAGMPMDDLLVRARHALPGPSAVEMTTPGYDPWRFGAAATLAAEVLVLALGAHLRGARVRGSGAMTLAGAIALPFLLPARGGP